MEPGAVRVLLAAVVSLFSLPAQPSGGVVGPFRPEDAFRAAFTADYTIQIDEVTAAADAGTAARVRTRTYTFTSRKGTTGAAGKTYRRFRLRVQEFADQAASADALRRLAEESAGDLFVKSPLLAFTSGPAFYRLEGACLYSPAQWQAIEERLLGSFHVPPEVPRGPKLRIACGGAVEESPLPSGKQ